MRTSSDFRQIAVDKSLWTKSAFVQASKIPALLLALIMTMDGSNSGLISGTERQNLARILLKANVLESKRVLVHLSQTCNLIIQGKSYSVLDSRELVRGASFAHGKNQIVILNEKLQVEQAFTYLTQRPLFCSGNELHTLGILKVNQVDPGGNVLVFKSAREAPDYRTVDENSLSATQLQE